MNDTQELQVVLENSDERGKTMLIFYQLEFSLFQSNEQQAESTEDYNMEGKPSVLDCCFCE